MLDLIHPTSNHGQNNEATLHRWQYNPWLGNNPKNHLSDFVGCCTVAVLGRAKYVDWRLRVHVARCSSSSSGHIHQHGQLVGGKQPFVAWSIRCWAHCQPCSNHKVLFVVRSVIITPIPSPIVIRSPQLLLSWFRIMMRVTTIKKEKQLARKDLISAFRPSNRSITLKFSSNGPKCPNLPVAIQMLSWQCILTCHEIPGPNNARLWQQKDFRNSKVFNLWKSLSDVGLAERWSGCFSALTKQMHCDSCKSSSPHCWAYHCTGA